MYSVDQEKNEMFFERTWARRYRREASRLQKEGKTREEAIEIVRRQKEVDEDNRKLFLDMGWPKQYKEKYCNLLEIGKTRPEASQIVKRQMELDRQEREKRKLEMNEKSPNKSERKLNDYYCKRRNMLVQRGMSLQLANKYVLEMAATNNVKLKDFTDMNCPVPQEMPQQPEENSPKKKTRKAITVTISRKEKMSEDEILAVEEFLLELLITGGCASTLNFKSSSHTQGCLTITCANVDTSDWIKRNFEKVKISTNQIYNLEIKREKSEGCRVIGEFPDSRGYSDERILNVIDALNKGIDARCWRVLERHNVGHFAVVTMMASEQAVEVLKSTYGEIFYRFEKIVLDFLDVSL